MPELIPPHGGVAEPIDRTVPKEEIEDFKAGLGKLPKVPVSDGDLSTLYRIGDGALSPLVGPMFQEEFDRVLEEEVIIRGRKKYAWTIPIVLPIDEAQAKTLSPGNVVSLANSSGEPVAKMEVTDLYPFDKKKYIHHVYQTDRVDHPGARIVTEDPRTYLIGGVIRVLPQPKHPEYGQYVRTPREVRHLIAERKWEKCVAFQTRNPLHRAHEYALIFGLEALTRQGFFTGAVLNPLIGELKSDDVDAATRMRTYRALLESGAFGAGDKDEELWAKTPHRFRELVVLAGLDMKMFYAGPKEAVMHAIYRQNYGFSNIVIGRKHADAPYDDGKDIWDGLAAQRIFDELKGELLIQPVKVGFAAFFEELGRVGLVDEYAPKGFKQVSITGRDLRKQLQTGELPDARIMRRSTAEILIQAMKQKESA